MTRWLSLGGIAAIVACGGGRDAWTDTGRRPSDALQSALAGEPSASAASFASAAPEVPSGPPRDLGPEDLECAAPWRCKPHSRWLGLRPEVVKARLGKPFFESDDAWHYMVQREECRAPSQRLVFHWPAGRVQFRWSRADLSCFPDLELPAREDVELGSLRGADERAVLAALGVPHYAEDERWTYRVPDGCADERDVTTIRWAEGRVRSARRKHVYTGEHCRPVSL